MASYRPTYQDYLALMTGDAPISEEAWNSLGLADQFNNIGGGLIIRPNDPRYAGLRELIPGEAGRNIFLTPNDLTNVHGLRGLVDPSQQRELEPGLYGSAEENQTPDLQAYGHTQFDPMLLALPLAFMGAGALAGGLGGGAAAGGVAGDVALPGMMSNFAVPEIGALDLGGLDAAMTGLGYSGWGAAGALGGAGGGAPVTDLSTGGVPVTDLSTNAGLGDTVRNLGSGLGLGGMSGLGIARGVGGLAATIAGLTGGGGTGNTSGGGGDGGAGGNDDVRNLIDQMANVNRYDQVNPFGSRHWTQDANGRWTVTDSLSPVEQQNLEGVQGLNSGITNMAHERLAQLMAQAARPRADRPIQWNGMTIGG